MKKSILIAVLYAAVLSFISPLSHAALVSELGGQVVYDADRDITWIADANLALTNQFGLTLSTSTFDDNPNMVGSGGTMTWYNAQAWIDGMNAFDGGNGYLGFNNWRLPDTLVPDSSCSGADNTGSNCTGSEMGHLYNVEGVTAAAPGLFFNIEPTLYFSGTEVDASHAYMFSFDGSGGLSGQQHTASKTGNIFVMAVRSGGVSAVPVPAAVWLFGSGLLGLIGIARRKKAA